MNNNIEEIKIKAKTLLYLEMQRTSCFPLVVAHPFFESPILFDGKDMFNALEEIEKYEKYKKDFYKHMILICESVEEIMHLIRKPYRLFFLKYLLENKTITLKECGNLLAETWSEIEVINNDSNVSKSKVLKYIKNADKNILMNNKEIEIYNNFADEIIIYRGCKDKKYLKGISWTLDKGKAEWFSKRFVADGIIYKGKIKKKDIIGYIDNRNEKEVICDYNKIYDIEEI